MKEYSTIYLKIKAQNYHGWYEGAQNKTMAILNRLFSNPEEVWQKALNKYHGWQEAKRPEYHRDDISNMSSAAQYLEQKAREFLKKKEDPKGLFESGITRAKADKSKQTKNSYTWDINRSGEKFQPDEVVSTYNISNVHDAVDWCTKNKRTIDSLIILLEALGKGGEQGNYTSDVKFRDEQSVANYIYWLHKAGKWHPETDHFTLLSKQIIPELIKYKKQLLGL